MDKFERIFAVSLLGIFAIVVANWFGASTAVTVGIMVVTILFAAIPSRKRKGKIRKDLEG